MHSKESDKGKARPSSEITPFYLQKIKLKPWETRRFKLIA